MVDPGEKRFDQRGLSDPRLPGHEDELAPAAHRRPQQLVEPCELGVPPDERRRGRGAGIDPGRRGRRGIALDVVARAVAPGRSSSQFGYRSDEPESPSMHGLDVAGRVGRIPERFPQVSNAGAQGGVADGGVTPDLRQQRLLRDQSPRLVDEMAQHGERPGHEREPQIATPRRLVLDFDPDCGPMSRSRCRHVAASMTPLLERSPGSPRLRRALPLYLITLLAACPPNGWREAAGPRAIEGLAQQ